MNKHRRDNISARIHPQDQMSTFVVYAAQQQRSSGERYQRVQTYSVICWSASEACSPMLFSSRAIPKSQIRRSQLLLTRRFFGFKSLWMIPAEWMYLKRFSDASSVVIHTTRSFDYKKYDIHVEENATATAAEPEHVRRLKMFSQRSHLNSAISRWHPITKNGGTSTRARSGTRKTRSARS